VTASTRIRNSIQSNVVGYVALFVALSGVAYAGPLKADKVKTKHIADAAVTTPKLADEAVTSDKVGADALKGEDIDESSLQGVGGGGAPSGPAGGSLSGSYPNPNIAQGAVNSNAVANDSLTGSDVAEGQLDSSVLQTRVGSSCSPGEAIRVIAANGTVTCETDDSGGGGPPSGPAGGDLTGTYPNPAIGPDAVGGPEVGSNALGGADIDESSLAGVSPSGPAGGDLTGTYPNPAIGPNAVGGPEVGSNALGGADIDESSLSGVTPSGSAGGELAGTYPNPTIGTAAGLDLATSTSAIGGVNFGADANLFRSAANLLRTNDSFTVDGTLTATGGAALPSGSIDSTEIANSSVAPVDADPVGAVFSNTTPIEAIPMLTKVEVSGSVTAANPNQDLDIYAADAPRDFIPADVWIVTQSITGTPRWDVRENHSSQISSSQPIPTLGGAIDRLGLLVNTEITTADTLSIGLHHSGSGTQTVTLDVYVLGLPAP
jgi:hypothetical protein